jgi:threonine synthase
LTHSNRDNHRNEAKRLPASRLAIAEFRDMLAWPRGLECGRHEHGRRHNLRGDRGGDTVGKHPVVPVTPEQIAEAAIEAIRLAARHEGLLLDPVYTGKAMAGVIDLCRKGPFSSDQNVVFLHTGGAAALFAHARELGS